MYQNQHSFLVDQSSAIQLMCKKEGHEHLLRRPVGSPKQTITFEAKLMSTLKESWSLISKDDELQD
jgi:hypothetical protein